MKNEAKRFDSAVQKRGGSNLDLSADSEMFTRFREALDNKIFLTGEEKLFEGEMVDMAHFEFMMACLKLPDDVNRYHLQQFYASLWPYIKKVMDTFRSLDNAFEVIVADQEVVLKKHAENHLDLQLYKKFFKDLPNEYRMKFKKYREEHVAEIERQKEAAIEREKKFRTDQLSAKEKKALERKFKV